jgi:hypothetical protein
VTWLEEQNALAIEELADIFPIFDRTTKAELVKFARTLEITDRAFVALILNANTLGLNHVPAHWEWTPPHLELTQEVVKKIQATSDKERLSIFRKIMPAFAERRLFTGHLFFRNGQWHLFFFDQRDRLEEGNRWVHGPHIHFVNFLMRPNTSLLDILNELDNERPRIKGGLHVRYKEVKGPL